MISKKKQKVSVVIPAYNEEKDILACLESLMKQSYKNLEVIIVDDGSKDNTRKIVKSFGDRHKNVFLIKNNHQGPGASRNLGAKKSKGEILVFVDADMTFDENYIKNLVRPFQLYKDIIGTTHSYEVAINTDNLWSNLWGKERVKHKSQKNVKKPKFLKGHIFRAIDKKKFLDLGGFDPRYGYADDQSLWINHRVSPVLASNTICYHKNPETLNSVYKQSRWIGASLKGPFFSSAPIKYIAPLMLVLLSPIAIPLIALKKSIVEGKLDHLHNMIIFIGARYYGTLSGVFRQAYLGMNIR